LLELLVHVDGDGRGRSAQLVVLEWNEGTQRAEKQSSTNERQLFHIEILTSEEKTPGTALSRMQAAEDRMKSFIVG
jgi:hypothetical protein